jgi:hypothetical protein
MKQLKQPQRQQPQDALEMEVFEDAPVADLDTPVAGRKMKMELKFLKTKDLMRQETSYNQEMRSLIQTQ